MYSQHGNQAFPGKGFLRPEDEELRQLKKKIFDLEEENEILEGVLIIVGLGEQKVNGNRRIEN